MAEASIIELVSDEQLAKYAKLVYDITGIRLSPQKKTLLSNRLRRRLRDTGIESFDAYYLHLRKLSPTDPEWDAFLQEITTHETYLFRDESNWNWFRNTYLPELNAKVLKEKRAKKLRIWSAACSTGDEAYTMACSIADSLPNYQQWDIKIIGTDIGIGAVEEAKAAKFGERAVRLIPEKILKRSFTKSEDGTFWSPKPELTKLTQFKQHNLLEELKEGKFDLVFLKNVLIYFDAKSKAVVIDNVAKVLAADNWLVTGAAEGVADILREKEFERHHPWLFRKM